MNNSRPAGFTLVEVLVAVALAGLIMAVAAAVLHTTRQVAVGTQEPLFQEEDLFRTRLRSDLDHLLPTRVFEDVEPFVVTDEGELYLVSLGRDENGIPHPYRLSYTLDGSTLIRIATGGIPTLSTTNQVLTSVNRIEVEAFREDKGYPEWPTEERSGIPDRLEIRLSRINAPEVEALFDLPASFSVEGSGTSEENNR